MQQYSSTGNLTTIGNSAFYGCSGLTSIEILDSITSIGIDAFYGCSSLSFNEYNNGYYLGNEDNSYLWLIDTISETITSCSINESCKYIGSGAFYNCTKITSITIPNSVIGIGEQAFTGCSKLSYKSASNGRYLGNSSNEYLWLIKTSSTTLTTFSVYNSCKNIYKTAFNGCTRLTTITLPASVTNIEKLAFSGCSALTTITIPFMPGNYLGYMFGADSYSDNSTYVPTTLKTVTITGGTSIGEYAFRNCSNLTTITLPTSVTSIAKSALNGCSALTTITIPFMPGNYLGYMFGANSYSDNSTYVPTTLKTVTITGGTSIGEYAFRNCSNLTTITLPTSVTSIAKSALNGCSALTTITIPFMPGNYLGYMFGANSYSDNSTYVPTTLKTVTITGGTSIGDYAFSNCSNITTIKLPTSVTSIGSSIVSGCTSLNSLTLGKFYGTTLATYFNDVKNYLTSVSVSSGTSVPSSYFSGWTNLTSISFPSSVTSIGDSAFANTKITSLTIPTSVTSIGSSIVSGCTSLKSLRLGKFYGTTLATYFNDVKSYLTSVSVSSGTSIPSSYFSGWTNLTSISFPSSVTSIGNSAFANTKITSLTIPTSVTSIGSSIVSGCTSLKSLTLGKFFGSTLATYFNNVKSYLTSVSVSSGTSVPSDYFSGWTNLTRISIPSSVTIIESDAFYNCSSLSSFSMPSGINEIGSSAFCYCSSLSHINVYEVESVAAGAFACSGLTSISAGGLIYVNGDYYDPDDPTSLSSLLELILSGDYAFRVA